MEENQEQSPSGNKKPSLLRPMLLWPLAGVPVFWIAYFLFLWLVFHEQHRHDVGAAIYSGICALAMATVSCCVIGAILGYRFGKRTIDNRCPMAEAVVCGISAGLLCLVYNFGGCMISAIGTAH